MNDDKIISMLLDHEERLERIEKNMATKKDIHDMTDTLDQILGFVQKKDQEMTMMQHGISRMNDDIQKIKPLVGLTA